MLALDRPFQLVQPFSPKGDQPAAIAQLIETLRTSENDAACLLGATAPGKTIHS